MEFPRVVAPTAKFLILIALGALSPTSFSEAATKCPSGQILRVSRGICVPKRENLSLMSKHVETKPKATKQSAAGARAPEPALDAASKGGERDVTSPVQVADRDGPPPAEARETPSPAQHDSAPFAAFGSLFVGAFRSTMSMGAAAFK